MRTDRYGFFNIRMESIGGYGAHIAGRILAEAGIVHQGLGGSNFSSYGSEKKGSPVKAFIRFCAPDQEVRNAAPIEEPDVIAVFHEALARTQSVTAGLTTDGVVLLNTIRTPAEARQLLGMSYGTIGVIDAIGIALAEGSRPNMVMLGALCRAMPFLNPDHVRAAIAETFERKYPKTVPGNLRAFDRGYEEVRFEEIAVPADFERPPTGRPAPAYGYLNAPLGGVISLPGSSAAKDLSASRQGFLPDFLREKCIDCAQCDLTCPDMCFVWTMGTDRRGRPALVLEGIDYQYCKGCLKCIEACPTQALVTRREEDGWADEHTVAQLFAGTKEESTCSR